MVDDIPPKWLDDCDKPGIGHNSEGYGDDVETLLDEVPSDAKLAKIRVLAKLQIERERELVTAENAVKAAERSLAEVRDVALPNAMLDLGIEKIPLTNGAKVELKTKTVAYVKVENQPSFFQWMHKKGYGSLPKRKIVAEFPMGEFKKAGKLLGYLKKFVGITFTDNQSIHAGTLNAWAKETQQKNLDALANGTKIVEIPDTCKITDLRYTVVALPKNKEVDWS